jgi:hypothetical protein
LSTTDPSVRQYRTAEPTAYAEDGTGWMLFAAVMLSIIAALNFIDGVAAVSNSKFYVANAEFVFSDLKTWGWILIVIAVVQAVVVAGRRGHRGPERDRAPAVHAGVPAVVARAVRARHPRHLRARVLRRRRAELT